MTASTTVICAACNTEFSRPSGDDTDVITCPNCGQSVSAATTAANDGAGEAVATLPEVCPVPWRTADAISAGSIQQFLTRLKSRANGESGESAGPATADGNGYELGKELAKGGMGAILAARDLNIRRDVAMKVMLRPNAADQKPLLRFIEEAQITGQLEHPGIVPVHQLGVNAEGNLFYTMKLVRGLTLAEIVRGLRKGKTEVLEQYPLGRLLNVFVKVCEAMAFAHSRGVIHRDLKPANIMVGEFGEVLVMDWGLGKVLSADRDLHGNDADSGLSAEQGSSAADSVRTSGVRRAPQPSADRTDVDSRVESVRSSGEDESSRTQYGSVLGTPRFMPPEQARGEIEKLDERSDVYSLGAILYNLLTLAKPVAGETAVETLTAVINGEVTHPDDQEGVHRPGALPHCPAGRVPSALSAVVMKALSLKKGDRYESVTSLQRDIEAWQTGFATSAEQAGTWRQVGLFIQRNRGVAAGVVAVFAALTIGLVATAIQRNRAITAKAEVDQLYSDLQEEQAATRAAHDAHRAVSRRAAPEFVANARDLLGRNQTEEAQAAATTAIALHEELPEAWYVKARLDIDSGDFAAAADALKRAQEFATDSEWKQRALRLASVAEKYAGFEVESDEGLLAERLVTLAVELEQLGDSVLAGRLYRKAGNEQKGVQVRVLAALRQLEEVNPGLEFLRGGDDWNGDTEYANFYWHHVTREDGLRLGFPRMNSSRNLVDLTPLTGVPVRRLDLTDTGITDLTALRGMPLTELQVARTGLLSIDELEGLPIEVLDLSTTRLSDLSVLQSLPLRSLSLREMKLDSLAPLAGLQLEHLDLHSASGFTDIGALRGMPLKQLGLRNTSVTDISAVSGMALEYLSLPSNVRDISALRGLPLKSLEAPHTKATDIDVLEGMPLESIYISSSERLNFEVLRSIRATSLQIHNKGLDNLDVIGHMKLESLTLQCPEVTDLSPLSGMPLKTLILRDMPVSDLSPLEGMPLTRVEFTAVAVEDISPLAQLPVNELQLVNCPVRDIEAVRELPLHTLYLVDCPNVTDVTPVRDLDRLQDLAIPRQVGNIEFLREMTSLRYLSTTTRHQSPDDFWREYAARAEEDDQ